MDCLCFWCHFHGCSDYLSENCRDIVLFYGVNEFWYLSSSLSVPTCFGFTILMSEWGKVMVFRVCSESLWLYLNCQVCPKYGTVFVLLILICSSGHAYQKQLCFPDVWLFSLIFKGSACLISPCILLLLDWSIRGSQPMTIALNVLRSPTRTAELALLDKRCLIRCSFISVQTLMEYDA